MTSEPVGSGAEGLGQPVSVGAHRQEQPTAADVIAALDLMPHPEGGHFRETYRAAATVVTVNGERPASTAILYLLTDSESSRFHRLHSDELWFYHSGALAELVLLGPTDEAKTRRSRRPPKLPERRVVGPGSPYALVPAGWWVAARAISGDQTDWGAGRAPERRWTADRRSTTDFGWTLVSCVVTPGFEYADFELADQEALLRDYPLAKELILALT